MGRFLASFKRARSIHRILPDIALERDIVVGQLYKPEGKVYSTGHSQWHFMRHEFASPRTGRRATSSARSAMPGGPHTIMIYTCAYPPPPTYGYLAGGRHAPPAHMRVSRGAPCPRKKEVARRPRVSAYRQDSVRITAYRPLLRAVLHPAHLHWYGGTEAVASACRGGANPISQIRSHHSLCRPNARGSVQRVCPVDTCGVQGS